LLTQTTSADVPLAFYATSLFAETFDHPTISAVTGLDDVATVRALKSLDDRSLIRRGDDSPTGASRFRLHRFTREFATLELETRPESEAVRRRFLDHYQGVARVHARNLDEGKRDALAADEWRNAIAAFDLAAKLGDAEAIFTLADVNSYLGRISSWAEQERILGCALGFAKTRGDRREESRFLNNLGIVYNNQGRWDDAVDAYEQSLAICRDLDDRRGEGQTLNNLGLVYDNQGRWDDAVDAYEQSLAICRDLDDRLGEGVTLNNLGLVYDSQGRWDDAVDAYRQSLAIRRDLKDRRGEGQTLNNLGILYKHQGRWDDAVAAYEQSLAIKREFGDRRGEGRTLENLARLWQARGDIAKALAFARKALAVLETTEDRAAVEKVKRLIKELEGEA
jgi:tetratricopeptide (TPR) repeat protein